MSDEFELIDVEAVRRRLIVLRHFRAGGNQTRFAVDVGIPIKTWNNFERTGNLSKLEAVRLCKKIPGLTLDWLYRGAEGGLPVDLQRSLAATERALTSVGARRA